MAAQDLALRGAGFGAAIGVQGQSPAEAVDAHLVMERTQKDEAFEAGFAAAGAEDHVVHLTSRGWLVAAAGPGAVLVAEDDDPAQVGGDALDLTYVYYP